MRAKVYACGCFVMFLSMCVFLFIGFVLMASGVAPSSSVSSPRIFSGGSYSVVRSDDTSSFFKDSELEKIWKGDYGVTFETEFKTLESVAEKPFDGVDGVLVQNDLISDIVWAADVPNLRSVRIGVSPMVVLARDEVVTALQKQGLIQSIDGKVRYINMVKTVQMMLQDITWSQLGVTSFSGKAYIESTNPLRMSSGFSYAQIILNSLNGGDPVKAENTKWLEDDFIKLMEPALKTSMTSKELFNQFIEGTSPFVAVPENMLIEYANKNISDWKSNLGSLVMLYPVPTVWTQTTLYVPGSKSGAVLDAMYDYKVSAMLWEEYGLRPSTTWSDSLTDVMISAGVSMDIMQAQETAEYKVPETLFKLLNKKYNE